MKPRPLVSRRSDISGFSCWCHVGNVYFAGELCIHWEICFKHRDGHALLIEADDGTYIGCVCPRCAWMRYAVARTAARDMSENDAMADNWKFIARLIARDRKASLGDDWKDHIRGDRGRQGRGGVA